MDGVRIVSDRRVGSSISFINPESISYIDIVKSPSSVVYGSDAIGGVINIKTKNKVEGDFDNLIRTSLGNEKISTGFSKFIQKGDYSYFFDIQYSEKRDYFSPDGKVLNSGYKSTWLKSGVSYVKNSRELKLTLINSLSKDVGKPDRLNDPDKYTYNPTDESSYFLINYIDNDIFKNSQFQVEMALNPTEYLLKNVNNYNKSVDFSKTTSDNYTFNSSIKTKINNIFSYQYGFQYFFRRNLDIFNETKVENLRESFYPLNNGKRDDVSLYATLKIDYKHNLIIGGLRYSKIDLSAISNNSFKKMEKEAYSYFLAYSRKLDDQFSIYGNTSKAFRVPSLSELFYTGISGRKYIIGNESLLPEKSQNIDVGLKWESDKTFVKLGLFRNNVSHLIERYEVDDGIYTFSNVDKGEIQGIEINSELVFNYKVKLYLNYRNYTGKSTINNEPLNDIPSKNATFGMRVNIDKGYLLFESTKSFYKNDPGPSEVENDKYNLVNISGTHFYSEKLFFSFRLNNLFNRSYFQNADPDSPLSEGFNVSCNIHYLF